MWLDLATGTWTLVPAPVSVVNVVRDGNRVLATGPVSLHPGSQTTWWPSRSVGLEASGWPVAAFDPARMAWEPVADPLETRWMALAVAGDGTLTAVTVAQLNDPLRAYELRGGAWHQVGETTRGAPPVWLTHVIRDPPVTLWTGRLLLVGANYGLTSWDPSARRFATTSLSVRNGEGLAAWSGSAVVALSNQAPAGWVWTPARP